MTEIERSGNLKAALQRLTKERGTRKRLLVPQTDLDRAAQLAAEMGINVTIQNLSKTKRRVIKP